MKHDCVEYIDLVDLDGDVVEVCKKHFPWGGAWEDPRVRLHIADGADFVKNSPNSVYDVIIQDSSDPWMVDEKGIKTKLPSCVLYEEAHFRHLHRVLTEIGVVCVQVI